MVLKKKKWQGEITRVLRKGVSALIELSSLGLERIVHLENRLQDNLLATEGEKSWLFCMILEYFMEKLEILDYGFMTDISG